VSSVDEKQDRYEEVSPMLRSPIESLMQLAMALIVRLVYFMGRSLNSLGAEMETSVLLKAASPYLS
jgi:hypothetical protein